MRAMEALQRFSGQPLLRSSLWEISPVDCPPNSPPFINSVIGVNPRPGQTPETFIVKLQGMEKEFGRQTKKTQNEPRPLDLDLIAFGAEIRDTAELKLPHPRAHLRRFVLAPLSEIAPDLVLPFQIKTIRELLSELGGLEKVRLVDRPANRP